MTSVTVLLQLAGPLQSWGSRSRFGERDTEREPTRSGVTGLVCAALGRDRTAPIDDLNALRFGVRVDGEGTLVRDYHTAQGLLKANKAPPRDLENVATHDELLALLSDRNETIISNRYYLCDAMFLVGLEGDRSLVTAIHGALRAPRWPLYLGRKSCVPGRPVWLPEGLVEAPLDEALRTWPWLGRSAGGHVGAAPVRLRTVAEPHDPSEGEARSDLPQSFAARRFGARMIQYDTIPSPPPATDRPDACS